MKTLLITADFPPIISGIGTNLYNMWKFLSSGDHFVFAAKSKGYRQVDQESGMAIIRYRDYWSRSMRIAALLPRVFAFINKERIDILICAIPLSIGFIGLVFKKFFNIPYIVFYYGGELKKHGRRRWKLELMRLILRNACFVIAISEFTRNEVAGIGIDRRKIIKITPSVDTRRFSPDIDSSVIRKKFGINGKKVMLTVARLVRRKGIDIVINALPGIIREVPDIVYLIVGGGEEEKSLKHTVSQEGLEKHVIFAGVARDSDIPMYYSACDLYVMPNRETQGKEELEGFGISFIEASACAKPVIGGLSGGVNDAVIDGETGILVDPDNVSAFISAATRILKDDAYALQLGRKGRERVETGFSELSRVNILKEVFRRAKV